MMTKLMRFIFIALAVIVTIVGIVSHNLYVVIGAVLVLGYLIYSHFKHASVWLAFRNIKRKRLDKAYRLLLDTPNPTYLAKGQKTYYYWGMGLIKISESKFDEAEREFYNALRFGYTTANNMVIINLSLAQICMFKEEYEKAKVYIDEAMRIPHKPGLDNIIYQLEAKLDKLERHELLTEAEKKPINMI